MTGIALTGSDRDYRAVMETAMHVLLAVCAVIIAGLAGWLAFRITTGEKSTHFDD